MLLEVGFAVAERGPRYDKLQDVQTGTRAAAIHILQHGAR
jgi:hypothetical protein